MHRPSFLKVFATVVLVGGFAAAQTAKPAATPKNSVTVDNTSANPVPITNPKDAAGNHVPLLTRDADNALRHAFQAQLTITTTPSGIVSTGAAFPNTPSVIEYVSGRCQTNGATQLISLSLETIAGSDRSSLSHFFTPQLVSSDPSEHFYAIAQQTRIYNDQPSNSTVLATELLSSGTEVVNCTVTISGHSL